MGEADSRNTGRRLRATKRRESLASQEIWLANIQLPLLRWASKEDESSKGLGSNYADELKFWVSRFAVNR